jgi:nicotinate-nucleotide pyrophosphorylase (carboxylating)
MMANIDAKLPYLSESKLISFIDGALAEDHGDGDHSSLSCIPADVQHTAIVKVKQSGILAGVVLAEMIFKRVNPALNVSVSLKDGDAVQAGDLIMTIHGPARDILGAERLVLNCMQRMSGIAGYTHHLQSIIAHTKAKVLDTRKTTPLVRMLEKWAVAIGGGTNHRFGLYDMIMLKDNHIDMAGGITQAMNEAVTYLKAKQLHLPIVVETRNLKEVSEVVAHGAASRILLDNMTPAMLREALNLIDGQIPTEASGGINEHSILAIAETGVDFISVGALTHSYSSLDIGLYVAKS